MTVAAAPETTQARATIATSVRNAIARMLAAPRFFNQKEWDVLAAHNGQIVSGAPQGHIPEKLEADDAE